MKILASLVFLLIAGGLGQAAVPDHEPSIVGRWFADVDQVRTEIEFRPDGGFSGQISDRAGVQWVFAGTWRIEGRVLHYLYTESSRAEIPTGITDEDEILKVEADFFEARNRAEKTIRYSRRK